MCGFFSLRHARIANTLEPREVGARFRRHDYVVRRKRVLRVRQGNFFKTHLQPLKLLYGAFHVRPYRFVYPRYEVFLGQTNSHFAHVLEVRVRELVAVGNRSRRRVMRVFARYGAEHDSGVFYRVR